MLHLDLVHVLRYNKQVCPGKVLLYLGQHSLLCGCLLKKNILFFPMTCYYQKSLIISNNSCL